MNIHIAAAVSPTRVDNKIIKHASKYLDIITETANGAKFRYPNLALDPQDASTTLDWMIYPSALSAPPMPLVRSESNCERCDGRWLWLPQKVSGCTIPSSYTGVLVGAVQHTRRSLYYYIRKNHVSVLSYIPNKSVLSEHKPDEYLQEACVDMKD